MPDNKRQHYVPRVILKKFSRNGSQISLYNIRAKQKIPSAPIKTQCYRDYMYGKDDLIDSNLRLLESHIPLVLKRIEDGGQLPSKRDPLYALLLVFITTLHMRTVSYDNFLRDSQEKLIAAAWENETFAKDASEIRRPLLAISIALRAHPVLFDLEPLVLRNQTDRDLVISDSPVVLCNLIFNSKAELRVSGLACVGLLLFVPISPKIHLLLYDPAVYRAKPNKGAVINISKQRDIDELNTLQFCSALENIYFQSDNFGVEKLERKAGKFRQKRNEDFSHVEQFQTSPDSQIITVSQPAIKTNLALSFLSVNATGNALRQRILRAYRGTKGVHIPIPIRDPELIEAQKRFCASVERGNAGALSFFEFLIGMLNK